MEFMVTMEITFPPEMWLKDRRALLRDESEAARPYLDSGEMSRVWRTHGTHENNHGHLALWDAPTEEYVWNAYNSFPLVILGYGVVESVTWLRVNPNDRHAPAQAPFKLTYDNLERFLTDNGQWSDVTNEGMTAELAPGVTVHDHPHSGRPRELHFMVDGQKIAEIGPLTDAADFSEDVAPGYIDLLPEWAGKPVRHDSWKNAILRDNGLLHPSHESAKNAPRIRREIP